MHFYMRLLQNPNEWDLLICAENRMNSDDVGLLQGWLKKQPHLPKIPEMKLMLFLARANSSVEAAKRYIENYYTIRTRTPEVFTGRDPLSPSIQDVMRKMLVCTLRDSSKGEPYVAFIRLMDLKVDDVFDDEVKVIDMFSSLISAKADGFDRRIIIIDSVTMTFAELKKWKLPLIRKYLYFVQHALPMHPEGVHILHLSPVSEFIVNLLKPLANEEYRDKIYVHSTVESLLDYVPREILPGEYGGNAGTFEELREKGMKEMVNGVALFKEEEVNDVVDETRRIGKTPDLDDVFSAEGTFRKLEID